MATSQQVYNALRVHNVFNILNSSAPINFGQFNDITDWSSLGITTSNGDVVKIIAQLVAPTGIACFENTGFVTSDFSSPDMTLTSLTAPQYNVPVYTGGNVPVNGVYVLNIKVQVTESGQSPYVVDKTLEYNLAKGITPKLKLSETWDCTVATYTSTDVSDYCADGCGTGYTMTNVVKTHTVYPPDLSGQSSVTASSTTILLGSPTNPLWTGTYEAKLSSVITYTQGDSQIITRASTSTEAKVICDDVLCGLYCQLKKLYTEFKNTLGSNTTLSNKLQTTLTKAYFAYNMARQARLCSDEARVEQYVSDFYLWTGTDPNCNCCKDQPAPVIPTSVINGVDGDDGETPQFRVVGYLFQTKLPSQVGWTTLFNFTDIAGINGTSFLQGSGVPSSGLGENGDSYLDVDSGNIYLKSAGSWSITGNLKGEDGVGLLVNEYTQVATTTTGAPEVLKSYTVAGGTFASNGDMLEVEAVYARILTNSTASAGSIIVGGEAETVFANFGTNISGSKVNVKLTRISSTALKMERTITSLVGTEVVGQTISFPVLSTVYDFTSDIDIELSAQDATVGTTAVKEFRITKFKI